MDDTDNPQEENPKKKGWVLCCLWKDNSSSWIPLTDLKESNPVETAEYAVSCNIAMEPAFKWWVPYVLKKRARIIGLVKA